nr:hypothetical protein [uncultured Psychroserpens sp.]
MLALFFIIVNFSSYTLDEIVNELEPQVCFDVGEHIPSPSPPSGA